MPMLSARSRRAGTAATATGSGEAAAASTELPPYEPLACALSDEAKRALIALANGRDSRRYEDHIKKSVNHLGRNVAAVNDRLLERQGELEAYVEKRTSKGSTDKTHREEQLEKWLPKLDSEVTSLSLSSETALRDLVDRLARVQDEKEATAAMAQYFDQLPSRKRPPRRRQTEADGAEENGDAEEPEDLPPPDRDPMSVLEEEIAAKTARYEEMDHYTRYALNNDYAGFRKLWHDARFGSQEVPLPDPSHWIDGDGNPVLVEQRRNGEPIAKDEDDVILEAEHQSYVCGLSMQQITEPYSNRQCHHVFQKDVIIGWLNEPGYRGRPRECPNPGCDKSFKLSDFYVDELVVRKVQRTRKREAEEEASEQGDAVDDDDDEDVDMGPRQSIGVKSERKRRAVEKIEDDEDDEA